jgi:hypothetical protein
MRVPGSRNPVGFRSAVTRFAFARGGFARVARAGFPVGRFASARFAFGRCAPGRLVITRGVLAPLVVGLFCALPLLAGAQPRALDAAPRTLDAAARARAVDSLAVAFRDHYVFPEVGEKMAERMRKQLRAGKYDQEDLGAFAQALTADLQAVSHDLHIRVMPMAPDELLAAEQELDPEEMRRRYAEEVRRDNYAFRQVERLDGNIGYLRFDEFVGAEFAGPTAVAALQFLGNCDAIIIDLRQNGGGDPTLIQLITSHFLEEPTHLNSFYVRDGDRLDQFWSSAWVPGPRLADTPLYVLTSGYTFSGAEEFSYNLRNLERATLVGERTGGGAHPVQRHTFADLGIAAMVPFGRAINPITGTNWEGTGVEPHLAVPADQAFDVAYAEALRGLLSAHPEAGAVSEWQWVLDGIAPTEAPILGAADLERFAGRYGDRILSVADGTLYYQREGRPRMRMIPVRAGLFRFEEAPAFRLEIVTDASGRPEKLIGRYQDGRTDESPRS